MEIEYERDHISACSSGSCLSHSQAETPKSIELEETISEN